MLALLAIVVLTPLLYIPGFLIAHALLGAAQPPDLLERHYERVVVGALLNGWLAFTLAELGVFSAWLHLLLLLLVCAGCAAAALRRGALKNTEHRTENTGAGTEHQAEHQAENREPRTENREPRTENKRSRPFTFYLLPFTFTHGRWSVVGGRDTLAFAAVGVVFAILVARPFEVVLGVRDAGVYANIGFTIARTGGIIQHDPLVAQIAQDQDSADPALRAAAQQAETNFLGIQHPERNIATRLRVAGFYINAGDLARGRVVPQFFHLFPAWIGLLAALLGLHGGLLATGLLGFLGLWGVGMLGRRLAGPWVGLLGMLFLALNGVQVWFSRYSTSEAAVQFLAFAGLYAFAVMATDDRGKTRDRRHETRDTRHETRDDDRTGVQWNAPTTDDRTGVQWNAPTTDDRTGVQWNAPTADESPRPFYLLPFTFYLRPLTRSALAALIAGLAFGQVALARIDFVLVIAPPLAYLFYIWLMRRWARIHTWLAAGMGAMLLHAALHVVFIARAYFFDTLNARLQDYALPALASLPFLTPTLQTYWLSRSGSAIGIRLGPAQYLWNVRRIAIEVAIVLLLCVGIWALRRWGQRLIAACELAVRRWASGLLLLAAIGIVALAAYGYLIRPQILTPTTLAALPGCLSPAQLRQPDAACLALQGYIGAPIAIPDYDRITYTKPLANLVRVGWYLSPLGVVLGIAGFALWWRRGTSPASWLFLVVGLLATVFFVRQSYGASDQSYIYILRRYIPQVYPAFSLGIAYALVALANRRPTARAGRTENQEPGTAEPETQTPQHSTLNTQHYLLTRSPAHPLIGLVVAAALGLALAGFLVVTGWAIYKHVEYSGALNQLQTVAERFGPNDVLLFHSGSRDEPDLVVTPLKFAFGLDAFTIKSTHPEQYAAQIARYVQRWREQGRNVYLIFGPNGGVGLPGLRFEPAGHMALQHLDEFEQLTDQKPHNVQDFNVDFAVYRLEPATDAPSAAPVAVAVDDYAMQIRGFYRAEQISDTRLAWTQGDALLRLPWPRDGAPRVVTIRLAGGRRPAALGAAQTCLSFRPEMSFGAETPTAIFATLGCVELGEQMAGYTFTIDPRRYPNAGAGAILLRMRSDAWVPARADPAQIDRRALGVQFGGLGVSN